MSVRDTDWPGYLRVFHTERAGVTQRALSRAQMSGPGGRLLTPYEWLAEAVPPGNRVLDLACGSAPNWPWLRERRYVGLDLSAAELRQAGGSGAAPLVRASATAVPLAEASADVVVCSIALMILTPLPAVLAEIRRVLRPGGTLAAIVPPHRPLRAELPVAAGLLAVVRRSASRPSAEELSDAASLMGGAGLRLTTDECRRFDYPLASAADADLLLDSLYLPGASHRRLVLARAYLRMLAHTRANFPLPIRRITAIAV